mgnify:CR=1 FL=1
MEWALYLLIMNGSHPEFARDQFTSTELLGTYETRLECEDLAQDLSRAAGKVDRIYQRGSMAPWGLERAYFCTPVPKAYIYE